jgi:hypothetical protein
MCWTLPHHVPSLVESADFRPSPCAGTCCRLPLFGAWKGQEKGNVSHARPRAPQNKLRVRVIDHSWQTETGWRILRQLRRHRDAAGEATIGRPGARHERQSRESRGEWIGWCETPTVAGIAADIVECRCAVCASLPLILPATTRVPTPISSTKMVYVMTRTDGP